MSGHRRPCECGPDAPAADRTALEPPVLDALAVALADERNALASYEAVLERFGPIRPFVNIAEAERRHIGALLRVYEAYGASPPEEPGRAEPAFRSETPEALCRLGVEAEIENARLYDEELLPAVAGHPDIVRVMTRLRDASFDRHRLAFQRCAERGGAGSGGGRGRGRGRA